MARRANLKAGSGCAHAEEGQKLPHYVPQGVWYCREMTAFYVFLYISGAGDWSGVRS